MACPTCDHTLAQLASVSEAVSYLHCERCGTVVIENLVIGSRSVYTPKLVERCREFEESIHTFQDLSGLTRYEITKNEWQSLGIAESINKPEDRPK